MAAHETRPRRRGSRWALVLALLLAACGSPQFDFVGSPDRKAFFKVPLEWREFTKTDLLAASGRDLSAAAQDAMPWFVAFDSSPQPTTDHVLQWSQAPDHPVVVALALTLTGQTRDQISLQGIRNLIYPVDQLLSEEAAEIRDYEELVLDGGYRGLRIEFDVSPGGNVSLGPTGGVIRVAQIGVLDPATEILYLLAVRCESHCFENNEKQIDQIVESWTVKEL